MSQVVNCRTMAFEVLLEVLRKGKSFNPQLMSLRYPKVDSRNISYAVHLCFGVLRFYFVLQKALTTLLHQPLKNKDKDLELLMMIGLFQLFYTDTPPHAAINETVDAAKKIAPYAKGLVNAVLRNALRQEDEIKDILTHGNTHPDWLMERWQADWPLDWEMLIDQNQQHPPFVLRVNELHISRDDYLALLLEANIPATALAYSKSGIAVAIDAPLQSLPGFADGWISVQDGSAQLAGPLLQLAPGLRVLDACAAPGGKTAHMLELEPGLKEVVALEKDPQRISLLKSTLDRLKLVANVVCTDASDIDTWWDNELFDRILLDAPCSATGVIRRHPDIKLHRKESDLKQLTKSQHRLLSQLWPLLKPGGILLYATCSTLAVENGQQIAHFLAAHSDAKEYPIDAGWGISQAVGRQILPGQDDMDGFYYARLVKSN